MPPPPAPLRRCLLRSVRDRRQAKSDLSAALEEGDLAAADSILAQGVDVLAADDTAAMRGALRGGKLAALRWIDSSGCCVPADSLLTAAEYDRWRYCQWLAKRGCDVDAADHGGRTPLLIAIYRGYVDTVSELLRLGASVDRRNARGETGGHVLARSVRRLGNATSVQLASMLAEAGMDFAVFDAAGRSAFQRVAPGRAYDEPRAIFEKLTVTSMARLRRATGKWNRAQYAEYKRLLDASRGTTPTARTAPPRRLLALLGRPQTASGPAVAVQGPSKERSFYCDSAVYLRPAW